MCEPSAFERIVRVKRYLGFLPIGMLERKSIEHLVGTFVERRARMTSLSRRCKGRWLGLRRAFARASMSSRSECVPQDANRRHHGACGPNKSHSHDSVYSAVKQAVDGMERDDFDPPTA